jgi:hypothetical protein
MERSRAQCTVGDDVVVPWEANRFPYSLALSVPWEANSESFREQARFPYSLALKSVTFAFGSSLRLTAIR